MALVKGTGLKVLDIGCGMGATLIELKRSGKAAVAVGVEINPEGHGGDQEAFGRADRGEYRGFWN